MQRTSAPGPAQQRTLILSHVVSICRAALLSSVDQVPALQGKLITGGGRLNMGRAVAALLGAPDPPAPALQPCEGWLCLRLQGAGACVHMPCAC